MNCTVALFQAFVIEYRGTCLGGEKARWIAKIYSRPLVWCQYRSYVLDFVPEGKLSIVVLLREALLAIERLGGTGKYTSTDPSGEMRRKYQITEQALSILITRKTSESPSR